ncbi:MAG: HEAT repeat domain-containing protein [Deltaproteobacteria bacterium]|nr:HEAT repeat domain-containing protein [Deltaproteobacteria bacterium]
MVVPCLAAVLVAVAGTARAAANGPGERFDELLAAGDRAGLEVLVQGLAAREPPAPLDAEQVSVVAAWEIVTDTGTTGLGRYQDLARAPGDPKWRILEELSERVLALALVDPGEDKRGFAIEEIEDTGLERFIEPLDRVVERDPSLDTRTAAAHAIRRIGGRKARAALRADLASEDVRVRRLAADELARMNDNTALRYLRREARTGTRDDKLWATERLGRLGDPSAFTVLETLIQDPEAWYRAEVVRVLDKYDDPRTIPVLRVGLEDSSDEVRLIAAAALADLKDATGLPLLRDFARSKHPTQRVRAFEKLAVLDDAESVPLLREALGDPSELVRDQAALALEKMGDPQGRAYVTQKQGTFGSLGALAGALLAGRRAAPDQPPPPPPEVAVETPTVDRYQRAQALRELGQMGAAGVSGIRTGLADPDPLVRQTASRALGKSGGETEVETLVPLLGDSDTRVRFAAAAAILSILSR